MKKLLLTFLIGITLTGFGQNLIRQFNFNKNGINIDSVSNNLALPGAVITDARTGVGNQVNDASLYFAPPNNTVKDINPIDNSTWTGAAYSIWVRGVRGAGQVGSPEGMIVQFPYGGYGMQVNMNGFIQGYMDGSSANPAQSTFSVNDGLWHHIVLQNNGSETKLFIDKILNTTITETLFTPNSMNQNAELHFGRDRFNNRQLLGELDEIRMFDDTLSQSQIDSLYDLAKPESIRYLEVDYKFNGNFADSSLNRRNLQNNNGNRFTFAEDRNANAGDSAVGVNVNAVVSFASMRSNEVVTNLNWESAALSVWVKSLAPGGASGNGRIVSGGGWALDVAQNGNLQTFFDGTSANPLSSPTNSAILDTNWHHVVAQNNGDTTYLYVDGMLEAQKAEPYFSVSSYRTIDHIYFGSGWYTGSSGPVYHLYASGLADDLKVFSRSLAQVEIDELFQFGMITGEKASPKNPVLEVNVFPNPAVNSINLPTEVHNANLIKVFNLKGQKVLESPGKQEINISSLDNGIYFLFIEKGGKIYRSKFMKQ